MSDVIPFPAAARQRRAALLPPIIAQSEIDDQEAAQKRRALYAIAWASLRTVLICIGALGLLGLILGV
ncbi:MAG TPA: hypothetical protein VIG24_12800 [Acidimicrobiia bacterium]